ncbi:hypothetical protein VKT23_001384 [Stygiomarasmius scandens]|uniref:Uncharacterized protein n=1 Tax=Marasmiellus scandens TaxID=2682957 RepID=A0ABR1K819_9AGAR
MANDLNSQQNNPSISRIPPSISDGHDPFRQNTLFNSQYGTFPMHTSYSLPNNHLFHEGHTSSPLPVASPFTEGSPVGYSSSQNLSHHPSSPVPSVSGSFESQAPSEAFSVISTPPESPAPASTSNSPDVAAGSVATVVTLSTLAKSQSDHETWMKTANIYEFPWAWNRAHPGLNIHQGPLPDNVYDISGHILHLKSIRQAVLESAPPLAPCDAELMESLEEARQMGVPDLDAMAQVEADRIRLQRARPRCWELLDAEFLSITSTYTLGERQFELSDVDILGSAFSKAQQASESSENMACAANALLTLVWGKDKRIRDCQNAKIFNVKNVSNKYLEAEDVLGDYSQVDRYCFTVYGTMSTTSLSAWNATNNFLTLAGFVAELKSVDLLQGKRQLMGYMAPIAAMHAVLSIDHPIFGLLVTPHATKVYACKARREKDGSLKYMFQEYHDFGGGLYRPDVFLTFHNWLEEHYRWWETVVRHELDERMRSENGKDKLYKAARNLYCRENQDGFQNWRSLDNRNGYVGLFINPRLESLDELYDEGSEDDAGYHHPQVY